MRVMVPVFLLASLAAAAPAEIERQVVVLRFDPDPASFHATVEVHTARPGALEPPGFAGVHWEPATAVTTADAPVARFEVTGILDAAAGARPMLVERGFFFPTEAATRLDLTIRTPAPWRAVAGGRRTAEEEADGRWAVTHARTGPLDRLPVLVAPWDTVVEGASGDTTCRVYTLRRSTVAGTVLGRLHALIERTDAWLPPPPSGRFDLVEFPFRTADVDLVAVKPEEFAALWSGDWPPAAPDGLWRAAARMFRGRETGRHSWLGALARLVGLVSGEQDAATRAASRRRWLRELSIDPSPRAPLGSTLASARPTPPAFGAMVLSMLRDEVGADGFPALVRGALAGTSHRALSWRDFAEALSRASERDLTPWFEPWLARADLPTLRFGPLFVEDETITGTVVQTQPGAAFGLRVPLRVTTGDGVEVHELVTGSRERPFSIRGLLPPHRITLDPDARVLRAIPRDQLAPCLAVTRAADGAVGRGDGALLERLGVEPLAADAPHPPDRPLLLAVRVGPEALPADVRAGLRGQFPSLAIDEAAFAVDGERYDRPGDLLLASATRSGPEASVPLTVLLRVGDAPGPEAARLAERHAFDGWVLLRDGVAVASGDHEDDRLTRVRVTRALQREPGPMLRDLLRLTDAEHGGRRAGTMESYKLANTLRGRLFKAGTKPVPWPAVPVPVGELVEPCELVLVEGEERTSVPNAFLPFHRTGQPEATPVFTRVVRDPAADADLAGALALLPEDAPFERAAACAEAGAVAVGVVASDDALSARAAECAWVGGLPLALAGRTRDEAALVAGLLARTGGPALSVPWLYVAPHAAERVTAHGGRGVLRFRVRRTSRSTSNIVGTIGDPRKPGILLCVAWDGPGRIGGEPAAAASWNASGVAALLWVTEQLARDHERDPLATPVTIVLLGGGHTGSLGALQLAAGLRSPDSPLARPRCIVRVAGVASLGTDRVLAYGRGLRDAPWDVLPEAFERADLALERRAPAGGDGGAHPLGALGVPMVTLTSGDPRLRGTAADDLALVDMDGLRRFARALYRGAARLASE